MDLNRRNFLAGTGLLTASTIMGTNGAIAYNQTAPKSPNPLTTGNILHDAKFATEGFKRYKNLHPAGLKIGRDLGIVKSPTNSAIVAYFDSHAKLTHGNPHPRASVESPARVYPTAHGNTKSTYWHYTRLYFPKSSSFKNSGNWCTFMEVHGAPWGASRSGLMIVFNPKTGNHYLRMGNDPSLLQEKDTILPQNQWMGVLVGFNYNYKSKGGWMRLFLNTTPDWINGWRSIPIKGQRGRFADNVISSQEGDGWYKNKSIPAATPRLGVYGNHPMKLMFSLHKLGRTPRSVLGSAWDGKVDGKRLIP